MRVTFMPRSSDMSKGQHQGGDGRMSAWNSLLYTLGGPPLSESDGARKGAGLDTTTQIPVTVLSGFLGAGKTTLLCELLKVTQLNVLAIVNDLAAVNIDAALVQSSNAETIALENGCACCVLGDDLSLTLTEIGSRDEKPDAIIIEASGVSDPMGIAQTVANNPATTLDAVLTLVDVNAFDAQLMDPLSASLMKRQLAASHLVLLTKSEDESVVPALQLAVGELTPGRAVLRIEDMAGSLEEFILGGSIRGARPEPEQEAHSYQRFANTLVVFSGPVPGATFFEAMDHIPSCVYRVKGWVTLRDEGKDVRYEFQAVGSRWRVKESDRVEQSDQLVVIGRKGSEQFDEFCAKLSSLEQ